MAGDFGGGFAIASGGLDSRVETGVETVLFRGARTEGDAGLSSADCESWAARLVGAGGSGMQTIMHELDYLAMYLTGKKQSLKGLF